MSNQQIVFTDFIISELDNVKTRETFKQMADRLGISKLCFLTPYDSKTLLKEQNSETGMFYSGVLLNDIKFKSNLSRALFKVLSVSNIVKARPIIEKGNVDMVIDLEFHAEKDYMHQMNSGMNHVIAKLLASKNVAYGINLSKLIFTSASNQIIYMQRIIQNIMLAQKYNCRICIGSFADAPYKMRSPKDIEALLRIFMARSPKQILLSGKELIKRRQDIASGRLLCEGVEIFGGNNLG